MNGPFTESGQGSEKPTGNGESQGKQQPEALPRLGQKQCGHWNSGEGWLQQSGCPTRQEGVHTNIDCMPARAGHCPKHVNSVKSRLWG